MKITTYGTMPDADPVGLNVPFGDGLSNPSCNAPSLSCKRRRTIKRRRLHDLSSAPTPPGSTSFDPPCPAANLNFSPSSLDLGLSSPQVSPLIFSAASSPSIPLFSAASPFSPTFGVASSPTSPSGFWAHKRDTGVLSASRPLAQIVVTTCTSCHRAISTDLLRAPVALCARCKAPTCAICSRTCEDVLVTSEMQQTPRAMSVSPPMRTVPMAISPPVTPRIGRRPLNVTTSENMSLSSPQIEPQELQKPFRRKRRQSAVRERKQEQDEAESDMADDSGDRTTEGPCYDSRADLEEGARRGCGRTFCRSCSVDDPVRNVTFCLDCRTSASASFAS